MQYILRILLIESTQVCADSKQSMGRDETIRIALAAGLLWHNRLMLLDLPLILETRRNHALEHATLHMLARDYPKSPLAGHSNPTGFFILGDVETADLSTSVIQALMGLRGGERKLAVHAGCGTNLAVTTLLSAGLAWLPLRGTRSTFWRLFLLPLAISLAVVGWALSQPLGPWLQANVTTEAELGDLQVVDVVKLRRGLHRVITKSY